MNLIQIAILSTNVGKNSLEVENPHSQQESLKCSIWVQFQKWQNDLGLFPRQNIQNHNNTGICPTDAKEAKVNWFY